MGFKKWLIKKVNRLTDDIPALFMGVLATIGAVSITDMRTGILIMTILIMLMYLDRNDQV